MAARGAVCARGLKDRQKNETEFRGHEKVDASSSSDFGTGQ